jgi:hypothetical protein
MKARGICEVRQILAEKLALDANGIPHPRHADLIGWPQAKHEWKLIQQKIAAAMKLEVRPTR